MTSHREAPGISTDPVADNTDVYAFVSPDKPDTVTIITNFIPLQLPPGGPNFFSFGDNVLYSIYIDNNADALPEITYNFMFKTTVVNPSTFLYNVGPISSLTDKNWNVRQTYTVTRIDKSGTHVLGSNLPSPPVNIGPRSTPNYETLANDAVNTLSDGSLAFAGQRGEGFAVDLGSIFDLLTLRPFQSLSSIPGPNMDFAQGVDTTNNINVHSIALQIRKTRLTVDGSNPTDVLDQKSVIGVWSAASRQEVSVKHSQGGSATHVGPWTQVSRLGNPLINEIFIPLGQKDYWNSQQPHNDKQFLQYYLNFGVAALMPVLYPTALPAQTATSGVPNGPLNPRTDLEAVLLTGLPASILTVFQNYTGATIADMLRLNLAVPPTSTPNRLGIVNNFPSGPPDLAGFPNGRRPQDDVIDIYLQVGAGLIYPLVKPGFTPPAAAGLLGDGVNEPQAPFLTSFPYLPVPFSGYFYDAQANGAPEPYAVGGS
jgi:Domain of unknown function (DUF4331)